MKPGDKVIPNPWVGEELTSVQKFLLDDIRKQETSIVSQAIESVEDLGEDDDDQEELEQGIEDDACRELGILEGTFKLKEAYGIKRDGEEGTYSHSTFVYISQLPDDLVFIKEWAEDDASVSAFSDELADELYNSGFAILDCLDAASTLEKSFQFIELQSESKPELSGLWFPKDLFQG